MDEMVSRRSLDERDLLRWDPIDRHRVIEDRERSGGGKRNAQVNRGN
jgi:hypothetical protein